jgi:hypothetical protein
MLFRRNRTTAHITLLLTIVLLLNMRWRRTAARRRGAPLQLRRATPRVAARRHTPVNTRRNRMRARLDRRALRVLPVVKIRPGARVATGKFRLLDRIHSRHSKFFASSGSPCPL